MRTAPDALMLFAAGFGTRMGALTRDRPKPLIEVAGRALLDHALAIAEGAEVRRIVVNTHYKADQIAAHLDGRDITLSHEAGEILDTGGGLRHALPLLGHGRDVPDTNGPNAVFTLNTDAVWRGPNPLTYLADLWDAGAMDALLLCLPPQRAFGHGGAGDFTRDAQNRLTRGPGLVYSGAQIIRTDALSDMPEGAFSLNLVWDAMMKKGRVYGALYPGAWCDVGHPGGITLAEDMLERGDV